MFKAKMQPPVTGYPGYTLYYNFEPGNYQELQKKQFEGEVVEKYVLTISAGPLTRI